MEWAPLVAGLRRLVGDEEGGDGELLARYRAGDSSAFAELVRRQGPMVLAVCRRVLGHEQDAEDVLQATFLTLALRPTKVRKPEALGSYLHGVALRLARKARSRRRRPTVALPDRAAPETLPGWLRAELASALDEEIARLPDWCREAFVLCHLQGRSAEQVSRQLGCPRGTVLSRLARARERLACRLRERGMTPGALAGAAAPLPVRLEGTASAIGARLLAGEAVGEVVGPRALELALYGGKMSKIISCSLLVLVLGIGLGASGEVVKPRAAAPQPPEMPRAGSEGPPREEEQVVPGEKSPPASNAWPESRLEVVLREWAKTADAARSVRYRFTQIEKDKVFGEKQCSTGEVRLVRWDHLRIDWRKGDESRIILIAPDLIYVRESTNTKGASEVLVRKPAKNSRLTDLLQHDVHWVFAGPPVRDLPRLCGVRLVKEDQWYVYLEVRLKRKAGPDTLERMRVVLEKNGFWVRQIWVEHRGVRTVTTDFQKPEADAKITAASIRKGLPKGWDRLGGGEEEKK
jgi:RNA polymerase sigma factor (sigma-70 family)